MRQWIATHLLRFEAFLDRIEDTLGQRDRSTRGLEDLPCVKTTFRDGLLVRVRQDILSCGHFGYWIELDFYDEPRSAWITIATVRDCDLGNAISLLQEAHDSLGQQAT